MGISPARIATFFLPNLQLLYQMTLLLEYKCRPHDFPLIFRRSIELFSFIKVHSTGVQLNICVCIYIYTLIQTRLSWAVLKI